MAEIEDAAVEVVGVVGAGFMGTGIAESAARAGVGVHLYEPDEAPLQLSRERLEESVTRGVAGGKLSREDGTALLDRVGLREGSRTSPEPSSWSRRSSRTPRPSRRSSEPSIGCFRRRW